MNILRRTFIALSVVFAVVWSVPAAADAQRGRLLVENHCQSCHGSVVHTRESRKVKSPAELRAFIARWSAELKLGWQDAERADVYDHLNNRYYRFAAETVPKL